MAKSESSEKARAIDTPKKAQTTMLGESTGTGPLEEAVGGRIYLPTQQCTGYYPSINAPCLTVRICVE